MENKSGNITEKLLNPVNGMVVLIVSIALILASVYLFVMAIVWNMPALIVLPSLAFVVCIFLLGGLKVIEPNQAGVYVLFGNYYGTIAKPGFFFINPFCTMINPTVDNAKAVISEANAKMIAAGKTSSLGATSLLTSKKVSLKSITLNNEKQKVNDKDGNPIEIGVVVIWRVKNATKAVFEVDNYKTYVSTQTDAAIRNVARLYSYDDSEDGGDEKSLRGSSTLVSKELCENLGEKVELAGIEILEARISHLAYAPEIAAAMLQRQQASAIIAARQKIVEGAVGMVELALNKLSENEIVALDEERKAQMVSNLLVVLCGSKETQPIINSGTIY